MTRPTLISFMALAAIILSGYAPSAAAGSTFSCRIDGDYVTRDNRMRPSAEQIGGDQLCIGEPKIRSFKKNGRTRRDSFRAVQLHNGKTVWVAENAVALGGTATAAKNIPIPTWRPDSVPGKIAPLVEPPVALSETPTLVPTIATPAVVKPEISIPPVATPAVATPETAVPPAALPEAAVPVTETPQTATAGATVSEVAPSEPATVPVAAGAEDIMERIPEKNWVRARDNLNLRNSPGTSGTKVQALIMKGGRLAVLDSKKMGNEQWHQVVPFDCDKVEARAIQAQQCENAYWVKGSLLEPVNSPSDKEIADHTNPGASTTDAGTCVNCGGSDSFSQFNDIRDLNKDIIAAAAERPTQEGSTPLFEEYMDAQNDFLREVPLGRKAPQQWAVTNKKAFVVYLVKRFGEVKASKMMKALTAYGEAMTVSPKNKWKNMAEMAVVMEIIDNRVASRIRDTYTHAKLQGDAARPIRVILNGSDSKKGYGQFSCWNKSDQCMNRMMLAKRNDTVLMRAFETLDLMEKREIVPLGALANNETRHYKASYVSPKWAKAKYKVVAQVKTPGGIFNSYHQVYQGVAL